MYKRQVKGKCGEGTRLFGSITSAEIAEDIKEAHGVEVDKKKIVLSEPIKELGSYTVQVKVYAEIAVSVKVNVVKEVERGEEHAGGIKARAPA